MKKKLIIIAAVFCGILAVLYVVGRVSGILLFFSIPTPTNLPNIKPGDKIYSTNLKKPVLYNFIVFASPYADSLNNIEGNEIKTQQQYLYRLCGTPGNIIEMKSGILYVSNKIFDKKLNLNNQYKISSTEFNLIEQADMEVMYKSNAIEKLSYDSTLIIFDSVLLKKYATKINLVQYMLPHSEQGPFKWNNKDESWTSDNFGPIKIPGDCYFVLGDNRHNALDSRYIGFVKKENIQGVVLNK